MTSIQDILGCLNHHNIRATYGAVGEVLGIPAFDVGSHLGERRKDASWVVSASSGKPSGYKPSDCHPALFENPKVIRRGEELQKLVKLFTTSKFETGPSATGDVQVAGIDLAWISEKNGSGIAIGSLSESRLRPCK